MSTEQSSPTLTRRRLLAASSAGALGASAGCIQRVRSILNRNSPSTASVTILAPPTDDDALATMIANELASNLSRVGIDSDIEYLPRSELYREVYINRDYDMFVGRLPPMDDPGVLRSLLHSEFANEPGRQNPYRFTSIVVDEQLDEQQTRSGDARKQAVESAVELLVQKQPFVTVGYPDALRAVRDDQFTNWHEFAPQSPLTYLALERAGDIPAGEELTLTVTTPDTRVTRNLNPLSAEFRDSGTFTGLLYDPLFRSDGEETVPWLASDIDWSNGNSSTYATVSLRPDLEWHDGEPLTAEDVSFTYRFLEDTSLGELGVDVPAPRFRGRASVAERVTALDEGTVEFEFGETSREAATDALTVPVLPAHIWTEKTGSADISGVSSGEYVTDAIVTSNDDAVGSGPLELESVDSGEELVLKPFENHFLYRDQPAELTSLVGEEPAFDELEVIPVPSNEVAIEFLTSEQANATAANVSPRAVHAVRSADGVELLQGESQRAYHVGFNTAKSPFSNPHFRQLIGRLVDKSYVVEQIFNGHGEPVATPLDGTDWNSDAVVYDGEDPGIPFLGTDGEVDVSQARDAFRDRGFTFDDDGSLVMR